MDGFVGGSREVYNAAMRRFLIVLTLIALLAASIGVGVLVAEWPRWHGGPSGAVNRPASI